MKVKQYDRIFSVLLSERLRVTRSNLKMKFLQIWTVFVISTFVVLKRGVGTPYYFYESGTSFKKGYEPMTQEKPHSAINVGYCMSFFGFSL